MIIYIPSPNIARIDGVSQDTLVVFTADESRVTVFLEQQEVHVRGCHLEGEPGGRLHSQLSGFHGFPININLRFGSRCQKFTKSRHIFKRADILKRKIWETYSQISLTFFLILASVPGP